MIRTKIAKAILLLRSFFQEHPLGFPIALLALALVTCGVFITQLGFYWDDWPPLMFVHMADKAAIWQYFSYDRPLQPWTYVVLLPIARDSAFVWQLFVILFRWTSALSLYFTFLLVLPNQRTLLRWAAVLFIVFPGFSDQYASVAFSSHFLTYTVFGLSLLTMALALKNRKRFWVFYPVSLFLTSVSLFTMEYFAGLEALRPVLIFLVLANPTEKKTRTLVKTIEYWAAYLAVFGFYLYWRMILYPAAMGGATGNYPYFFNQLISSPISTLLALGQTAYDDLRFMLISAWTDRLLPFNYDSGMITLGLSLLIGLASAWIYYQFLHRGEKPADAASGLPKTGVNILLGFLIILAGMAPLWSTLRQVTTGKWSERFDIPAIWGIAFLIATLIVTLIQNARARQVFFVLLVGLSAAYQIRTASDYRRDNLKQQDFYTQLSWRIPSLEPGTALYAPTLPAGKEADYSFSMGINLLYSADSINFTPNYWLTGPRYYNVNKLVADPAFTIQGSLRNYSFSVPASHTVSIYMPPTGCLWVLDEVSSLLQGTGIEDLASYGKLTNQTRIIDAETAVNGLVNVYNFNRKDQWCYYFEKGDLAQSKGEWQKAVSFYEQAQALNLIPLEAIEYLPFVKAYASMNDISTAATLSEAALKKSALAKPLLCKLWHDILTETPSLDTGSISEIYNAAVCPAYFTPVQS